MSTAQKVSLVSCWLLFCGASFLILAGIHDKEPILLVIGVVGAIATSTGSWVLHRVLAKP